MTDALGVADRVRDGDGPALRDAEEGKTIEPGGVDHRLEIAHPRVERELVDVPVG